MNKKIKRCLFFIDLLSLFHSRRRPDGHASQDKQIRRD
jgi:hypothetical protein